MLLMMSYVVVDARVNATELQEKVEQIYKWAATTVSESLSVLSASTFSPEFTPDSIAKSYSRDVAFTRQVNAFRGRVGALISYRLEAFVRVPLFDGIHEEAARYVMKELNDIGFVAGFDTWKREMYVVVPTPNQQQQPAKKKDRDDEEL